MLLFRLVHAPIGMASDKSIPLEAKSSSLHASLNPLCACEVQQRVTPGQPKVQRVASRAVVASRDFDAVNCNQLCLRSTVIDQRETLDTEGSSSVVSNYSAELLESERSVAGLLYKWVNFGKGWRPRWFVLKDGVLSYYKVHGPNKITLSDERHPISRIIGDESRRLMKKEKNVHRPRKAFGEVHLQVSSIRTSRSDDKKFYIFTGTKTIHLRAESKEDRNTWVEALFSAKEHFTRTLPKAAIVPTSADMIISTDRLRNRLLKEGLPERVIEDCEAIMRMEFLSLQEHVRVLEQGRIDLLERIKRLEGEKLELETTVMDQSQSNICVDGTDIHGQGGSEVETDDEKEIQEEVEAESEEDESIFFDTYDCLVPESFGHPCQNSVNSLRECPTADGYFNVGFEFPHIERRKKLPDPKEQEKRVNLWSMIRDNIGKDLTKICLPVYFNEPISALQKCFEDLEYSHLLDHAYASGIQGNSLMQTLNVAAFAVSGYSSTEGRICKPFNPLLGETYEADYPDKGLRFVSEKVSHHPMTLACHCEGRGWVLWGDCTLKSKFWGHSIQLDPLGYLNLKFASGQTFQWKKVTTSIYNIILGKLYCDHYGTMRIQGNGDILCKIVFKEQSIIERNPHQVQGYAHDKNGRRIATLFGKWDESLYYVPGDLMPKSKNFDPRSEAKLLWRCNDRPEFRTRYNLTAFAITLNEITPGLKEKLPPTDSRFRPDQRYLENGEYELANMEKLRLEEKQRQARKLQETGWRPRWFQKNTTTDTFEYKGGYWEARNEQKWEGCPDIFGIQTFEGPFN